MDKTTNFKEKAEKIHGEKYNYDKVEYINVKTKIEIYCNTHKEYFLQAPDHHLRGSGCKKCGIERGNNKKFSNTKDFIEKSKKVHGDTYSYDKVEYIRNSIKVTISCKKEGHGEFQQTPADHLQGKGCSKCGRESTIKKTRSTTEEFIEKAKKIHGDEYDYSDVEYINAKTPVILGCKKHGRFFKKPYHLLQGTGCQVCGMEKSNLAKFKVDKD